jgi:uncharacterized membrane protein YqjE
VDQEKEAAGPLDSVRALGATIVEALETRVELALVELREEGERRKGMVVLAVTGALFLSMGLLLAALVVVVFFWDTHRLAAIAGVTLLYLGIGVGAFLRLRERARSAPPPFEATLRELAADREMRRGRNE